MACDTVSENTKKLLNGTVFFVEWKIQDFLSLPHKVGHRIRSPSFRFDGAKWFLWLYPNGKTDEDKWHIRIYLVKMFSAAQIHRVNYHLGISTRDGSVYRSWRAECDFKGNVMGIGASRVLQQSEVCYKNNKLAPNGVVTVFCYLQLKSGGNSDASTHTALPEGARKLAKNLEDLLLSKEACDIRLKVKNQEFQAHKAILVARSSVFSSMFRHEMAEKLSGEVNIPDCDPDAFQLFLVYLYTGTVEGISTNNVFNLYAIANKYEATELKMNCTEYMKCSLSVDTVCDVIALSLLHNESDLLDRATDFFTKHFKHIIVTIKWRYFLEENLTTANELLVKVANYYDPSK